VRPPPFNEIAGALAMDAKKTESFLVRVSRLGFLVRVSGNRFFSPAGLLEHARFTEEIAGSREEASPPRSCGIAHASEGRSPSKCWRISTGSSLHAASAMSIVCCGPCARPLSKIASARKLLRYNGDASYTIAQGEEKRTPVGRPDFKSGERR
jgi:hypothetical protein